MKIMVLGATGATGRHAAAELLRRGVDVVTPVRSIERLGAALGSLAEADGLTALEETVLEMAPSRLEAILSECDAVVSCLGHNLSLRGIYGRPRRLVADSIRAICETAEKPDAARPLRIILMNTTGNRYPAEDRRLGIGETIVMGIVRLLLPPQRDNEQAAAYLAETITDGNRDIEWTAVRPDSLVNDAADGEYAVEPAPVRSPIFNPGRTSRANVGLFMAELLLNDIVWDEWKGRMPVIYNRGNHLLAS